MYKLNLLPEELVKKAIDFKRLTQGSLVILPVVIMLAAYGFFLHQTHQAEIELAQLRNKLAGIQPDLNRLDALRKQRADLEKAASDLEGIAGKRVTWSPVITEINSNTPTDAWLTGLRFYFEPGDAPAPEADLQKNRQQGIRSPNPEVSPGTVEGIKGSAWEKQGKEDGRQGPIAAMPLANAVLIQGESRSVLPVGVLVNRLMTIRYFTDVRINDISEVLERGTFSFSIRAQLGRGER